MCSQFQFSAGRAKVSTAEWKPGEQEPQQTTSVSVLCHGHYLQSSHHCLVWSDLTAGKAEAQGWWIQTQIKQWDPALEKVFCRWPTRPSLGREAPWSSKLYIFSYTHFYISLLDIGTGRWGGAPALHEPHPHIKSPTHRSSKGVTCGSLRGRGLGLGSSEKLALET
jgi:hypothetical protein